MINQYPFKDEIIDISRDQMHNLVDFTFDLLIINEKGLAKRVFDISNKFNLRQNDSYNFHLVNWFIYRNNDIDIMKTVIDFSGYHKFFEIFEEIRDTEFDVENPEFQKFIENIMLLKIEK